MKVGILCGGLGTRISEETHSKPKPMVEVGNMPILCHIMNTFSKQGYNRFALALGYKSSVIKRFFLEMNNMCGDIRVDMRNGDVSHSNSISRDWLIDMVETGDGEMTGGRLLKLAQAMDDQEDFILTYGDGVANVNVDRLAEFHKSHGRIATVTAVRPPARFGHMKIEKEGRVSTFAEKSQTDEGWINGGYFVFNKRIFDYLSPGDVLEEKPLKMLSEERELMAYRHNGFWQCMDTLRDKRMLESLVKNGSYPWLEI